jgi:two-component sensor histidine kinase
MGARSRLTTIRFRLGLAVALALSPVLALGALQSWTEFRRDAQAQSVSLTQAAQRSALLARARIRASAALLETLTPQVVGVQCAPQLARLLDRDAGYLNLIRFDGIGRVQCAAATVPPQTSRNGSDWFGRLKAGADLVVASIPQGLGPEPALLAAVRSTDERGRFNGGLASVIRLDSLKPDTADPTLPPGTQVALADAQGRLLVATQANAFAPLPEGWAANAARPGGTLIAGKAPDGGDRVQAVAPLVDRDIYVVLSAPRPGLLFWARLNPFATVILPLLAWLAAWAGVTVASERVVIRWLVYLERVAAIYAKGRFSVRPTQAESDGAPAETQALAHTLGLMADAIVERDKTLHDNLAHKDALMREIHHRVKNNLQVITSLLNMQQRALTDPAARAAMSDTRQRITALALIYRALYQSPDLRRVDVRQFLEELVAHLTAGEGGRPSNIRTQLTADDLEIDPDKLAPLALFAVEAITNARKHAYGDEGGLISVRFAVSPEEVVLEISDQGRGDADGLAGTGVGRTLMSAFARQLRGRAEVGPGPQGGVVAALIFPAPEPPPGAVAIPPAPNSEAGNQAAA